MPLSILAAVLLGLSKAGIKGPGVIIVSMVAYDYGSKPSTGILIPLLIFADILAVSYYRKEVNIHHLYKFMPMMIIGVGIAAIIGEQIPEDIFKFWMAIIILLGLILMIIRDIKWKRSVPHSHLFNSSMGFMAGFTTMIGNLAGPFANLYFLSHKFGKLAFIGTAAWVFFIINIIKLPIHFFHWKTIDSQTLMLDLMLIIPVIIGFILGIKLVKYITDYYYKLIIYISTGLGSVLILLS
jgi:uncharacterized membrane protein YfcA